MQPAPVQVTIEPAPVPETVVNVLPAPVTVAMPARKTETTVLRDANGNIVSATQVEKSIDDFGGRL